MVMPAMEIVSEKGKGKAAVSEDPQSMPTPSSKSAPTVTERAEPRQQTATAILVIGMAGSGKTTFMQRANAYLHERHQPPYIVNLDPAVVHLPFEANIDIRDTVDYHEVMKQYNLGPNGGILTALNLFTTKFDQVLGHIEKRASSVDYMLLDTPGQIEIFTWSASGAIITDAMASTLPTCVAYIIDTPRTTAPATFMSNMLYACSILYKTRLPFILVFNKTDVQSHEFAIEWMRDFEAFQAVLVERQMADRSTSDGPGYMDSLMNSMSLVLDEFYKHLRAVGVSAMTGDGMAEFFDAVKEAKDEYNRDYKPELDKLIAERKKMKEDSKANSMSRLLADMAVSDGSGASDRDASAQSRKTALDTMLEPNEDEDERDDEDGGDIIDRSSRTDYYPLPEKARKRGTPAGAVGDDGTLWPAP